MAHSVLIIGDSGSGKSTGIRNLNHEETVILNTANKPLPFKGWKSMYCQENKNILSLNDIVGDDGRVNFTKLGRIFQKINERTEVKNFIIDDFQYLFAFEYFARANEKGYDKFTQLAKSMSDVATAPITLRDDLMVFFLTHAEEAYDTEGNRKVKAKTIGKMVDNVLTLEGLFSIVLFAKSKKSKDGIDYLFETQTNGENTCKSPMGMFETRDIPNDLQLVREAINNYEN